MRPLMRMEFRQAFLLIDAFGFIRKENGVAIKGDAQFIDVTFGVDMRMGKNLRGGKSGFEGLAYIIGIGR